jgi:superfamily II DNA or RNA helicase
LYKGLQFNIAQFHSIVHGLKSKSQRLLIEELLFSNQVAEPVPSVP